MSCGLTSVAYFQCQFRVARKKTMFEVLKTKPKQNPIAFASCNLDPPTALANQW
jgi:hypothetical protein